MRGRRTSRPWASTTGASCSFFCKGKGHSTVYVLFARRTRALRGPTSGEQLFLQAFRLPSLPFSDAIAGGQPAGPCQGYPNADTWIDEPIAPGVVLIGDASGDNGPTIGQGLSVTMRDVRLVSDAISTADDWHEGLFADYASERRERMRRLRLTARLTFKTTARIRRGGRYEADRGMGRYARGSECGPAAPRALHRSVRCARRNL